MIRSGAFAGMGRVELRRGRLHRMSPQYTEHMRAKLAVWRALDRLISEAGLGLEVGSEGTVLFAPGFQPMPDVFIWDGDATAGPIPGDQVRLVVEIADTTQRDDLGEKRLDYARAGLAEYWVADLAKKRFHRCHGAGPQGYAKEETVAFSAALPAATLDLVLPAGTLV